MKYFFLTAFLLLSLTAFSQQTITLRENMVLTETLVISENTRFEGNGFSIRCDRCKPAIRVKNGVTVHFENVRFRKGYQAWMSVGRGAYASWDSPTMKGHMTSSAR